MEDEYGPYRPLVPLTRGQLAEIESKDKRIAELESRIFGCDEKGWSEFVAWSQGYYESRPDSFAVHTDGHLVAARKTIEGLESQLSSALDSQKAAVAALAQERALNLAVRAALIEQQDTLCPRQHARQILAMLAAGKESGG
jgi:hypothetical protein